MHRPSPHRRSVSLASSLFLLLPLVAAACEGLPALEAPRAPAAEPAQAVDVLHYAIDLSLAPARREIEASCTIRMQATDDGLETVALALAGLSVRSVRDGAGRELAYTREGDRLLVRLAETEFPGRPFEVVVEYGGHPVTGLWFAGRRAAGPTAHGPSQVYSHGQPEHNRGWFPCVETLSDRATSELRVTMPKDWVAFGPGRRVEAVDGPDVRTEHWQMDEEHPSYLMSVTAGDFVVKEEAWQGIPLYFAAGVLYEDWMEGTFAETDDVLGFLVDYTGVRYPYPKYSQVAVENFAWSGMENVSATTLTELALGDERGARDEPATGLIAHEAAHQWFGDLLTCADWSELWLNEGFATYLEQLYFEATRGPEEFQARMRDVRERYLSADQGAARRPIVATAWEDPEDLFGPVVYEGGAVRLHQLRRVLGDDPFRAGVRTYAAENKNRSVTTDDLRRAMEKVSGQELGWFFDQWFGARGFPEISFGWRWDARDGVVRVDVRQVQGRSDGTPAVFRFPVTIEIHDASGYVEHELQVDDRRESFELATSGEPFYVLFDKGGWLPAIVSQTKSAEEWLALTTACDDVNARRDGVTALGRLASDALRTNSLHAHETYVAEIADRLARDSSPWVRSAAARALGEASGLEAREQLQVAARGDGAASVRVAALEALARFGPSVELADFARAAFDEGYSWRTMGAAAGLYVAANPEDAYAWLTQKLFVDSPHDELCRLLLVHLGGLGGAAVNDQLVRWARDESVDPTARAEAVRQLARQQVGRATNARAIAELLDHENHRLRRAAVEALAAIGDHGARQALKARYPSATAPEKRVIEAALGPRVR